MYQKLPIVELDTQRSKRNECSGTKEWTVRYLLLLISRDFPSRKSSMGLEHLEIPSLRKFSSEFGNRILSLFLASYPARKIAVDSLSGSNELFQHQS